MRQSRVLYAVAIGMLAATTACSQAPTATAPTQTAVAPDSVQPEVTSREAQQLRQRGDDDGRRFGRRGDRDTTDRRDGRRRFRFRYRPYFFPYYQTYYPYYQPYYPPYEQGYAQNQVVISNYQFMPGNLDVPIGTTVTWINQDSVPHTVTSPLPGQVTTTGYFDGVMQPGQSYSYTFNLPGRIDYYCRYHPAMRASVTVGGGGDGYSGGY